MNVVYLDPGLASYHGHHAASCRAFLRGFASHGISPRVYAHRRAQREIGDEFDAVPLFTHSTYWEDKDVLSGWFRTAELMRKQMVCDLDLLPIFGTADLVIANSVSGGHLLGLADWLARKPVPARPTILVEFGHDPGVDPVDWPPGTTYRMRDPRLDARACWYRSASHELASMNPKRVHLFTFESFCSKLFSRVLDQVVATLPSLLVAEKPARRRLSGSSVTIGIAGSQRREKGYHLVPNIVMRLLAAFPEVRFLIHNSGPTWMPEAHAEMAACAAVSGRIRLIEEPATPALWQSILETVDLMLCPYDARRYHASYSAVAVESLANAIPLVGPSYSSIHRLLQTFPGAGDTFDEWTIDSIVQAVGSALHHFDHRASKAYEAATIWQSANGPSAAAGSILDLIGSPAPTRVPTNPDIVVLPS